MVVDIPYPLARLEALRRMSLEDTVLSEVAPAAKNIQHPDEASEEHWVGVEGGLFKPCERETEAYLIYARASSGACAQLPAVAEKKAIRKKKAKMPGRAHASLLPPLTRSQARPRSRVQTERLLF